MGTLQQVELAVEEFGPEGPTGRLIEVEEAAVVDYGDNEIGRATTSADVAKYRRAYDHRPSRVKAIRRTGPARDDLRPKLLCDF